MMKESATPKEANAMEVYVKSEPSLEGDIKSEPLWDDACVQEEPLSSDVCVKAEPLRSHVCKDEPSISDVFKGENESSSSNACVKDEPSCPVAEGARGVSEAAAAARLYADHVVKDELVLGPELVEPRRGLCSPTGKAQQKKIKGRPETYQCGQCGYTTARKTSLVRHERKHTGENLFICDHCDYTTSVKALLQNHMSRHTLNSSFKYSQCGYTSSQKGKLLIDKRIHTGEKPYKCDQCSYASTNKVNLKGHERLHTGEKPYKCGQCSYASAHKKVLKIHERIHTGEKPYKCDQCSYASAKRANLKSHERLHTGEKPYKCGQCSYASAHKKVLKIHERIHTGETPYKCEQCSYASARKRDLKFHERIHTGGKLYKCGQCNYASVHKKNVKAHKRRHTGDNVSRDICAAAAPSRAPAGHHTDHDHTYGRREPAPPLQATSTVPFPMFGSGASPAATAARSLRSLGSRAERSQFYEHGPVKCIPMKVHDIINLPIYEFDEQLFKHDLSEAQLLVIRDIRRHGRNKMAAQKYRKRMLDEIASLADEVRTVRNLKQRTQRDHHILTAERQRVKERFAALYRHVFQNLRDAEGRLLSSAQYSLLQVADGNVVLVTKITQLPDHLMHRPSDGDLDRKAKNNER